MNKSVAPLAIIIAIILSGCAEEELICAYLEDQAQVCRPASEAVACSCGENALIYDDEGIVMLYGMTDNAYQTLDELYLIFNAFGIKTAINEEWLDGPTWSVHLFLIESDPTPFYIFYGWRVIARFDEQGFPYASEHITFWGLWTDADSDIMRPRLEAYAESIELL